jgi:plastocyanin
MIVKSIGLCLAVAGALNFVASPALAQAGRSPTWAEFQQLQNELRETRQQMVQLVQSEQQRYDALIRAIQNLQSQSSSSASSPAASGSGDSKPSASISVNTSRSERGDSRPGTIEGKVKVPGGDTSDLYVFVENYRGPLQKGKAVEIKQENKQFIPRVAVVPMGSSVSFPNLDPIFHNVFSNSPKNSFDLGSYRAGDKTRAAVFNSPGVVDIYCNMHQRMSAHVLVVPSKLYVRVKPDGSFRLEGVPAGARTLVAWSPSLKPVQQKVDVDGNDTARVAFEMEYTDQKSHTNKMGQPYGSYKE